ncbi:MAG: GIY-YIG nuclease family protein [Eubacteriales bacterium]
MPYFVYILRCRDDTLYTGMTNNFEARLALHSSGKGAKYTRGRTPLTPVYLKEVEGRSEALKEEARIKKLSRREKEKLILQ